MSITTHSAILTLALVAVPPQGLANAKPVPGEKMLAIAPPWPDHEEAVQKSDGRVMGPMRFLLGAFAISDQDDFASKLKDNGVWFAINGTTLASLSGV